MAPTSPEPLQSAKGNNPPPEILKIGDGDYEKRKRIDSHNSPLNVNSVEPIPPSSYKTETEYESPEDGEHRRELEKLKFNHELQEEASENNHKRNIDLWIYRSCGLIVMAVTILFFWMVASPIYGASQKEKAWSGLTIIVSGAVGLFFGKTSSSESKK